MFQQRQLSNRATSSADLLNDTSQLLQRNLTNRATQPIESCNASCRLKISPDDLFPSEKTLQNVDVGDLTRVSSSDYWYY